MSKPQIEQVVKYDAEVWSNVRMDELRRDECLCFNCRHDKDSCVTAEALYDLCVAADLALMVTRCRSYEAASD